MVNCIKAKKYFGQNFLTDSTVINKIIQSMPDMQDFGLVEIGPGLGDLTKALLEQYAISAYEIDEDLYEHLKKVFEEEIKTGRLELVFGDVMEHWRDKSLKNSLYWIVANIPYYITTPIIYKVYEDINCLGVVLMVQKEVALKLTASPSTASYSSLSVLTSVLSDARILFDVPKEAFSPPPKVVSSVIKVEKNGISEAVFCEFKAYLSKAFKSPRKTLKKNLSIYYDQKRLFEIFSKLEIDTNLRPHELAAKSHFRLFNSLTD
ncbi:MAG: 16S rRNA (adenine(1518)-N(6)/adenine(1519)-N(6))-dimethyltransferase RsmA [Campylobacteraceae bacterium]|jgi:16S rRNA (adenine1518-N6/adenine1519-N6)-dimethyltransferase|nr:16S rRNA (adenine(1518)-N(6)/adenine(1519)-N(6))-dimethyltransferase RsmA [Campylobacteraceae bacterium]